jgi:hypothetical protein
MPKFHQFLSNIAYSELAKRCAIAEESELDKHLSEQCFLKLPDSHTRRNCVGIDDNIGAHTVGGERHVTFGNDITYGSLLPVSRGKFVTDYGFAGSANTDFRDTVSVAIAIDEILVDI